MNNFNRILIITLTFKVSMIFSQEIIRSSMNSFGDSRNTSGFYFSQSVGQSSSIGLSSNDNLKLYQGFQQPISTLKVNDFLEINSVYFKVFPNPNSGEFQIKPFVFNRSLAYKFKLYNDLGQLIFESINLNGLSSQSFQHLTPGSYLLDIFYDNKHQIVQLIITT